MLIVTATGILIGAYQSSYIHVKNTNGGVNVERSVCMLDANGMGVNANANKRKKEKEKREEGRDAQLSSLSWYEI